MDMPVMPGLAETWVPRQDARTVDSAREAAHERLRSIQRDSLVMPPTRPATLRAYRSRRYVAPRRPVALFSLLAVLASALTLTIMIAVPWQVEMSVPWHASSAKSSRLAELALLQRDTLLAGACWPRECVVAERK